MQKRSRRTAGAFFLAFMSSASSTGGCRDHMALAVVGQVLLFDSRPGQGIIGVAELVGGVYARTIRFMGLALGRSGYLNCRPGNQRRGEKG
jgi:hypothetical protein